MLPTFGTHRTSEEPTGYTSLFHCVNDEYQVTRRANLRNPRSIRTPGDPNLQYKDSMRPKPAVRTPQE
ncbi:Hypp1605 [Branchiostoma lanceolatum]|uniref:Hypp1605 protein n=1 Tax=Branchiostoma lanceolatum TaxID=7740 RepID=A0A8K0EP26_BRALA|nr:Hypp1605 [Branchiostoma lanceolatum]